MKNILVTTDFDKNEKIVLDKALHLAEKMDSKIWLLHVAAPNPDFVGYDVGPEDIRKGRTAELRKEHRQLQEYTIELRTKGVEAEGLLVQGATIEMIMAEARKLEIDMIIVGSHEHNFFYKAFVGSVSSQIAKKSKIPILIVPLD